MSAPAGSAAPATPSRVLGVALGLAVLLGLVLVLALRGDRALEPEALLAELFEDPRLPEGLAPAEAAQLSGGLLRLRAGDQVLRLTARDAPPEAPRVVPPKGEAAKEQAPVDWLRLPEGPKGTLPAEVLVVRYPRRSAAAELERLFTTQGAPMPGGGGRQGPPQGGTGGGPIGPGKRVLDRGTLPWGPFSAEFVHEREYEQGGTFVDRVRVNVSVEGRYAALFLRWPRGLPASKQRAGELLAALPPRALP